MQVGDRITLYGGGIQGQGTPLDTGIFAVVEEKHPAPWNLSATLFIAKLDTPCELLGIRGNYVVLQLHYGTWEEGALNVHLVDGPLGEKWTFETLGDITVANVEFSIVE